MKTSGTNRKLRILLTSIRSGSLIPRPEFQRRLVWSNKHKIEFIRTVLMELPFPEIYIAAGDVDPDSGEGTEMLVDGQQRMTTLYQYFTGSEDLTLKDIRLYQELSNDEKMNFLEYEVVVRDLGKKSIEEIKEVFTRINSTKYSLNAMEIHNARFDGEFKQFGEKVVDHQFFDDHRIFNTNDMRRMGDLLFCTTIIITIMSTYFNRDDDIEEYLRKYNDEFPESTEIYNELSKVFEFLNLCNFNTKSRVWKKADLFTLIVELYKLIIKEQIELKPDDICLKLSTFYQMVDNPDDKNNEFVKNYYKATIQATNDRSSRILRGSIIEKLLKNEFNV